MALILAWVGLAVIVTGGLAVAWGKSLRAATALVAVGFAILIPSMIVGGIQLQHQQKVDAQDCVASGGAPVLRSPLVDVDCVRQGG